MAKLEFHCTECGSNNLGHQYWVESVSPVVIHSDGRVEYGQAVVNENNGLGACAGFLCGDCKHKLYLHGSRVETETELITYLNLTPEERSLLENADSGGSDDPIIEEGVIIFPESLDNIMGGVMFKDYRQCGYSEEEYETNPEVTYRVDKYVNKYALPTALAIYLHDNGYHDEPETVKANLNYVNNAMREEGYHLWVDITPEQIRETVKELTSSEA